MGRKKIKLSKGPCPYCGHDEIFDKICFLCGRIVLETKQNGNNRHTGRKN